MKVQKMTKTQVFAYVRKHGTWDGYMMPCKMYNFDLFGTHIHLTAKKNAIRDFNADIIDSATGRAFVTTYNAWAYYNCTNETGLYAHYYMIV